MVVEANLELRTQVLRAVREFVQRDVLPIADRYDNDDIFPHELVVTMKEMGLFGCIVPEEHGGLGLDFTTYAMIIEEICKGWMSVSGILNSHLIMAYTVAMTGTEEQKRHWLPLMASGEKRGGLCLTEPNAGSDVQAIEMTAVREGEEYVINGTKMFVSNGEHGNTFLLLAKTDRDARPPYKGISAFIAEKGPGLEVSRHLDKLGYRGLDTSELVFQDFRVPAENLVGGEEGQGFYAVMSALELGRINVAARSVGVATAAFEAAVKYAQQRKTFGKPIAQHQAIQIMLADMATKVAAARLLTYDAAAKKDRGERCDLEAGMAKLYASEICQQVAMDAMRIHGGYGYIKEFPLERYYRDAPLMIIGEGTNEIQKLVIARNLLKRYAI
ncbi:MAG: hypothetical protein C1O27_000513 [Chloroflexi bacterium]|jgi:alkylation response protein AidB-like acyl-CoA dehydrogenase|nr:MAG: hypothetical protein C1O27_000513 [Chloroflexota bacterium]